MWKNLLQKLDHDLGVNAELTCFGVTTFDLLEKFKEKVEGLEHNPCMKFNFAVQVYGSLFS